MARRGQIIQAAANLFAERGFAETNLRQIAARADMALGTLHYYFPSKDTLVESVINEALHSLGVRLRKISVSAASTRSHLRKVVTAVYESFDTDWDLYSAVLLHGEQIRLSQPTDFPSMTSALAELVAAGQSKGEVRTGDPHFLAMLCHGLHIRVARGRLLGEIQPPLTQYVDAVTDACWRVLQPDKEEK